MELCCSGGVIASGVVIGEYNYSTTALLTEQADSADAPGPNNPLNSWLIEREEEGTQWLDRKVSARDEKENWRPKPTHRPPNGGTHAMLWDVKEHVLYGDRT